jgi:adenosylmethionine-8-amino-7-oxononanoate aminotransferase
MLAVAEIVLDRFSDRAAWGSRIAELESQLHRLAAEVAGAAPHVIESFEAFGGVARFGLRKPVAWEIRNSALRPKDGSRSTGALVASTGMAPDIISLHPPLTISDEDLALVRDALIRAVRSTG